MTPASQKVRSGCASSEGTAPSRTFEVGTHRERDAAIGKLGDERRVERGADAVLDARGAEYIERLANALRAGDFTGVGNGVEAAPLSCGHQLPEWLGRVASFNSGEPNTDDAGHCLRGFEHAPTDGDRQRARHVDDEPQLNVWLSFGSVGGFRQAVVGAEGGRELELGIADAGATRVLAVFAHHAGVVTWSLHRAPRDTEALDELVEVRERGGKHACRPARRTPRAWRAARHLRGGCAVRLSAAPRDRRARDARPSPPPLDDAPDIDGDHRPRLECHLGVLGVAGAEQGDRPRRAHPARRRVAPGRAAACSAGASSLRHRTRRTAPARRGSPRCSGCGAGMRARRSSASRRPRCTGSRDRGRSRSGRCAGARVRRRWRAGRRGGNR